MKIAIFLGSGLQTLGGGFTFESEILNALFEFTECSNHRFVICHQDKVDYLPDIYSKNFESISLQCSVLQRLYIEVTGPVKAFFEKIRNSRYPLKVKLTTKGWIEDWMVKKLVSRGIDLILYLTPYQVPVMDLPYISVLWDLAHRIHPYFPEVSQIGEWETREKFYGTTLRRATKIITGTDAGKGEIKKFYQVPSERIHILPFPTPEFALGSPALPRVNVLVKYGLPSQYLFYPAQFWPHKNHVGLLKAVKLLSQQYNLKLPLVLVGSDKGNKDYVQQVVTKLDLANQVHFLGFVPREDLVALYQHAFAMAFVSFLGPDNLPPLEAFALECPVIAADVSGAREQLGDAALLVNPTDHDEIARVIMSLWQDSMLRQELIRRGLDRAKRWTVKDYVQGLFKIIDDFIPIHECWGEAK